MSRETNAQDSLRAPIRQQANSTVCNHAAASDHAPRGDGAGVAVRQHGSGDAGAMKLGLVDSFQLSRECLASVLYDMHPKPIIVAFASVQDYASHPDRNIQLVLYVAHDSIVSEATVLTDMAGLRQAAHGVPIVVLSEAESINQPSRIRTFLDSGAQGFIPAATTGVGMIQAAVRFVHAGGTYAPLSQLMATSTGDGPIATAPSADHHLTPRQAAVLEHLRQGKANKIIAYELRMSESTVKVHVRNIMRKLAATNRTQVAYKAQLLYAT